MSDSVAIPLDLLTETRLALDVALSCMGNAHPECTRIEKAKRKIDKIIGEKSDTIQSDKRQEGFQLLRHLDEVRRKVKKDYGIEK